MVQNTHQEKVVEYLILDIINLYIFGIGYGILVKRVKLNIFQGYPLQI